MPDSLIDVTPDDGAVFNSATATVTSKWTEEEASPADTRERRRAMEPKADSGISW